jgi:hypothetical protein
LFYSEFVRDVVVLGGGVVLDDFVLRGIDDVLLIIVLCSCGTSSSTSTKSNWKNHGGDLFIFFLHICCIFFSRFVADFLGDLFMWNIRYEW